MPRSLTAQDRMSLIRLASSLPSGSTARKTILRLLAPRAASGSTVLDKFVDGIARKVAQKHGGKLVRDAHIAKTYGDVVEIWVGMTTPLLEDLFVNSETGELDEAGNAEADAICDSLAKAFGVPRAWVDFETQDSVGYIFGVGITA
jgi:hypothetical protein